MILLKREKTLLKILGFVVICAGLFLYFSFRPKDVDPIESNADSYYAEPKEEKPLSSVAPRLKGLNGRSGPAKPPIVSLSDFESHNTVRDCWALIEGGVYDVTPYLTSISHRNEAAPFCGTFAFEEGFMSGSESLRDIVISLSVFKGVISQS